MKQDQRGFVLSGAALLLVLPAMILAASFLTIVGAGGEAVSLQITADKVFYTGEDIERVLRSAWDENILFDNKPNANGKLEDLAENYRTATGLIVNITPSWMLWTLYGTKKAHAGTWCKITRTSPDNWLYHFESFQIIWDYNDIVLGVSKIGENLKITIVAFDPIWNFPIDVYYGDNLLWKGAKKANVGESKIVAGTTQLTVSFNVRDPRGAAQYSSIVN